jgi:hypothetical protein
MTVAWKLFATALIFALGSSLLGGATVGNARLQWWAVRGLVAGVVMALFSLLWAIWSL